MKVALIYKDELKIGDFRYCKFEKNEDGIESVINFDDGNLSKPMIVIQNPILDSIDYDSMIFIDPKTGDKLKVIPFDHVSDCYEIEKTMVLRKKEPELPVPSEYEGDFACNHDLRDDGDNLQIFCTKCGLRKTISFSDEDLNMPLDFC